MSDEVKPINNIQINESLKIVTVIEANILLDYLQSSEGAQVVLDIIRKDKENS